MLTSIYNIVAAIAPWFCLRLPSCGPGHTSFFQFVLGLCWEKKENKQKEAGIGPFFLKKKQMHTLSIWTRDTYVEHKLKMSAWTC